MAKAQLEKDSGLGHPEPSTNTALGKPTPHSSPAEKRKGQVRGQREGRASVICIAKPGSLLPSPAPGTGGWVGTACFLLLFTLTEVPSRPIQLAGQGAWEGLVQDHSG